MNLRLALQSGGPERPLREDLIDYGHLGLARVVGVPSQPVRIEGRILLAGYAFRRGDFAVCDGLDSDEATAVVASQGRWAIDNLWGNYLLGWAGEDGDVHLLRSPVTGPALYHFVPPDDATAIGACLFSDLGVARALGFALDRPDAAALDAHLRFPLLRAPSTGLDHVTEILPGDIATLGASSSSDIAWLPWDHVGHRPRLIEPARLRTAVISVVEAWSGRFDRIQLELSGGLDSSIVAACLAGRDAWRAVNLATPGVSGDERPYARAAAARAGAQLLEIMLPAEPGDPLAPVAKLRARPAGFGLLSSSNAALLGAARDFGADAIFSGAGGDNIFGFIRRIGPVVDAFRFAGPRTGLKAAGDLADLTGDSIWRALRLTARRFLARPADWPSDDMFLTPRFAAPAPPHPWLEAGHGVSAGQFGYGRALLPIQPFLDGYDRAIALPMISPLLSQPLVEFGLSIATWQWCEGGQDRALARRAFAADLPDIVRERRTKGRVDSLFAPAFDANRARLRDFLLEGWLAGAGVLDRDAVDQALRRPANALDAVYIRLLQIADVERWVRSL